DGQPVAGYAGVVDQREHGAEVALHLLEERLAIAIGHVGVDRRGAAAGRFDRLHGLLRAGLVGAVVDADEPAVGGQRAGDRGADALGRASHQCCGVLWPAHEAVHSITPAPQVKPAPIAASRTLWPGRSRPSSRASDSVSGTEAADVLPSWEM